MSLASNFNSSHPRSRRRGGRNSMTENSETHI